MPAAAAPAADPRPFRGHRWYAGWSGLTNGALLARIAGAYDCFVTIDKNLPSQQAVAKLPFGVIILMARSNKVADVTPFARAIAAALPDIQPGQIVRLPTP